MKAYAVETVSVDRAARSVVSDGAIGFDSAVLRHHFPGFPILPGVLMLDMMRTAAEKWYEKNLSILSIKRVRFSNYLKPGANWQVRMHLEDLGLSEDRWSGEILSAGVKMASAVLTLRVKG